MDLEKIKSNIRQKISSKDGMTILHDLVNDFILFNYEKYNNKFTRKIVKGRVNIFNTSKMAYFNYLVGETIKLSEKLLDIEHYKIRKKLFNILQYDRIIKKIYFISGSRTSSSSSSISINDILKENEYLLYIFFYTIPTSRKLIEYVKEKNYDNFGKLYYNERVSEEYNWFHSFNSERFVDYDRINIILNIIDRRESIDIIDTYKDRSKLITLLKNKDNKLYKYINTEYKIKILNGKNCFDKYEEDFDFTKLKYIKYTIKLDIPLDFICQDIRGLLDILRYLNDNSEMKLYYYKYDDIIDRYIYDINNVYNDDIIYKAGFSNSIGSRQMIYDKNIKNIFIILSYCLFLLKNKNIRDKIFDEMTDIDKIKKIIIIFYYINILYTPYCAGTASISEISLFVLWNKYVNYNNTEPLFINQNIMIDVEALSHSFTEFYYNCFNKDQYNSKYTPYFYLRNENDYTKTRNEVIRNYYRSTKEPFLKKNMYDYSSKTRKPTKSSKPIKTRNEVIRNYYSSLIKKTISKKNMYDYSSKPSEHSKTSKSS